PLLRAQRFCADRRRCEPDVGPAGAADGVEGVAVVYGASPYSAVIPRESGVSSTPRLLDSIIGLWNTGSSACADDDSLGGQDERSLRPLELQSCQPRIESIGGDQRGMGALLDDTALIHHH